MDSFEFAQIPIAIVIGFAISEIFSDWGEQIRGRHERAFSPLQLVASLWLLAVSVRYLWIQWAARAVDWGYGDYLLSVAPAGAIALATHVGRGGSAEAYERDRRPRYLLFALIPALLVLRSVSSIQPEPGALRLIVGLNAAMIACFLTMAWVAERRVHWAAWAVVWAAGIAAMTQLLGSLSG